jgi:hypothetical protein
MVRLAALVMLAITRTRSEACWHPYLEVLAAVVAVVQSYLWRMAVLAEPVVIAEAVGRAEVPA